MEGAIGGVVVAVSLCVIYGVVLELNNGLEGVDTVLLCFITGFVGSIFSQIGRPGGFGHKKIYRHKGLPEK